MTDSKRHPAIGIDLGTTFSTVAYLDSSGRPDTIRNSEGDLTTPSVVFFDRNHPIVGIEAVEAGLLEPERLAQYAKRDVGEHRYEKSIRGEQMPPEVLEALVLRKLKADAELVLGPIEKAVVTVPAFFNEPCRKATQDAGRLAGLEVMDIINEPTAAAITYGVQRGFLSLDGKSESLERVLVYDLGGGTFDVTLMEIDQGNYRTIATAGDVYLGGVDWDRRIVEFVAEAFMAEHDYDPREDPCAEQELLRKANQAKHALTQRELFSFAYVHEGNRLRTELSQSTFAEITEDLVERTLMTVGMVMDDAHLKWSDVTRLLLVGGSTRMPMIRDELHKLSGLDLDRSLSPDEAVSHGAALYAGMLLGNAGEVCANVSVKNVNSHDLGVLAVQPDTGEPARQIMIPRNSALPARKLIRFRTHKDNQSNVKIEVVEGGDDKGTGATHIGKCYVDDLPVGTPKGTEVQVQFDYAQDGRLTVSAELPAVKRKMKMTLNRAAGLSEEEIEKWQARIESGLGDDSTTATAATPEPLPGMAPILPDTDMSPLAAVQPPAANASDSDSSIDFHSVAKKEPKAKPKLKPVQKAKPGSKPSPVGGLNFPDAAAKPKEDSFAGLAAAIDVGGSKPNKPAGKAVSNSKGGAVPKIVSGEVPKSKAKPKAVAKVVSKETSKPESKQAAKATPVAKTKPVAKVAKTKPIAKAKPVAAKAKPVPTAKAIRESQPAAKAKPVAKAKARPAAKPAPTAKPKPASKTLPSFLPNVAAKAKPAAKADSSATPDPKIDLGIDAPDAPAKATESDLSVLMSLADDMPKVKPMSAPIIVTSDDAKQKKSGWKGRAEKLTDEGEDDES